MYLLSTELIFDQVVYKISIDSLSKLRPIKSFLLMVSPHRLPPPKKGDIFAEAIFEELVGKVGHGKGW